MATVLIFSSSMHAGVRQGGVLSPCLFAIFIDGIVHKINALNIGCYYNNVCVSIFMYADDILLLAPTVTGLQLLFNVCEAELADIDMHLNIKKSMCLRFGTRYDRPCENICSAQGEILQWVDECRYLGVYLKSGRLFKCSFHYARSCFFRSFNSIFSKIGRFASEEVILNLVKTKCLPCLLYSVEACPLVKRDKCSFDFSLTRLFMKIFRTGSIAVVNECQVHFTFLPLKYQIDIRTANFLEHFKNSNNTVCAALSKCADASLIGVLSTYGSSVKNVGDLRTAINELFYNDNTH